MSKQAKETLEGVEAYKKHFRELLRQAEDPEPGNYEIEVAEVLTIGEYGFSPEVAIIKDTQDKIWAIPENSDPDTPHEKQLISRWDIRPGMKLRLTVIIVAKKIIPEILTR